PAGWVYDNVLQRLAEVVQVTDPALAAALARSTTTKNGGFLDLRSATGATLATLVRAADEVFHQVEKQGSSAFQRPEFYPGFREHLQTLRDMLRARQRALDEPGQPRGRRKKGDSTIINR